MELRRGGSRSTGQRGFLEDPLLDNNLQDEREISRLPYASIHNDTIPL